MCIVILYNIISDKWNPLPDSLEHANATGQYFREDNAAFYLNAVLYIAYILWDFLVYNDNNEYNKESKH